MRMLEFLIREEGSGRALAALRRGAPVQLEGPHGRFHVTHPLDAAEALFVAGGTGIAPIRSMLMDLLGRPHHPRCTLLYSARSSDEFAYATDLRRLARDGRLTLAFTVTRGTAPRWRGLIGRVSELHLRRLNASRDAVAFVCGPPAMVADVRHALDEAGVKRVRGEEQ
jgi:NAD(P)H-flavin reductase